MSTNKHFPLIDYTSRDFNSIRSDLIQYARRYYSNTYKDFSESGFGSMMVDSVAYIGDILSFYLDYNVNETFLDTAVEYNNILRIGRQMGFKFTSSPASFGEATFYAIVPASTTIDGPDTDYVPILQRGTQVSSIDGIGFTLNENVDFANPNNEIVVARANNTNGNPTSFAIKATGQVISGKIERESINVGAFVKFPVFKLVNENISEIVSVIDSQGNEYYEVDYLSQDVVYRATTNRGVDKNVTQANLRPFAVPRRFVTENLSGETYLKFGFGSSIDNRNVDPITDPSDVVLKVHGKDYTTDINFDPSNLISTDKFGVAPSNTVLTVKYRVNSAQNVNIGSNSLTNIDAPLVEFQDLAILNADKVSDVVGSIEVSNEEPISGDVTLPTVQELKTRISDVFASQNRAVTLQDYKSLCYQMPGRFGAIKRVTVVRDPDSFKRNLNLYILSEDDNGFLIKANTAIKENLKLWIDQGRMVNDTLDIMDAKVINLGIEFTAIASLNANKFDVLNNAVSSLSNLYKRTLEIGDPFYVTDIYNNLNKLDGIIDVTRVKIVQKTGANYSNEYFDVDFNYSDDGRYIKAPVDTVFELKYPTVDIKGSIK